MRHYVNNGMLGRLIIFLCISVLPPYHISRKGDTCQLHTVTKPKVWNFFLSSIGCCSYHPFYSPLSPADRDDNPVRLTNHFLCTFFLYFFGINPTSCDSHIGLP